jgi:hypothetical protein
MAGVQPTIRLRLSTTLKVVGCDEHWLQVDASY